VIAGSLATAEGARPVEASESLVVPASTEGDAAFLPADGAVGSWRRVGRARVYTGAQLYDYTDGGVEVFYELGFERATVQRYADGEDETAVALYAMRDPEAALGIYLLKAGPGPRVPPAAPPDVAQNRARSADLARPPASVTAESGLDDRHTAGRHQLMLVRGCYFLIIDNLSGKVERAPALVEFARQTASALPPSGPVTAFDLLPSEGLVPGSERLVRGPLTLQAFILLGDGDVLQLEGRITAVAARYDGYGVAPHVLLVAPYADAEAAARALAHVEGHLDPEIQLLSRSDARLVFRDYSGGFGVVALSGSRLVLTLGLERTPEP
jgi:hypothetical protein